MKPFRVFLLLTLLFTTVGPGYAEETDPFISFGLRAGYYKPSLRTFNRVIADPSLSILQDPNFLLPRNPGTNNAPAFLADCSILPPSNCVSRSIASPGINGDSDYGADISLRLNSEFSIVISVELFQSFVTASDTASLLIRQDLPVLRPPREARYNLQINQYFISWRYHMYNRPRDRTLYFDLGLLGLAEADLTMDALMKVLETDRVKLPNGGFTSVSSTEATGFGFVIHFGIGGEYYLTNWLSVGVNAQYVLGNIPKLEVRRVFTAGFPDTPDQPPEALLLTPVAIPTPQNAPNVGDYVTYAPVVNENANREVPTLSKNLPIELDGFDVTALIRFHF
jgi:hypothetical protein